MGARARARGERLGARARARARVAPGRSGDAGARATHLDAIVALLRLAISLAASATEPLALKLPCRGRAAQGRGACVRIGARCGGAQRADLRRGAAARARARGSRRGAKTHADEEAARRVGLHKAGGAHINEAKIWTRCRGHKLTGLGSSFQVLSRSFQGRASNEICDALPCQLRRSGGVSLSSCASCRVAWAHSKEQPMLLLLLAVAAAAQPPPPPPQVRWPGEFRALVNESIRGGARDIYVTEYSLQANAELRVGAVRGTTQLFDYNSSRVFTFQPAAKTCTAAPASWPIFAPRVDTFKCAWTFSPLAALPSPLFSPGRSFCRVCPSPHFISSFRRWHR